jgi:hypothetical protein
MLHLLRVSHSAVENVTTKRTQSHQRLQGEPLTRSRFQTNENLSLLAISVSNGNSVNYTRQFELLIQNITIVANDATLFKVNVTTTKNP